MQCYYDETYIQGDLALARNAGVWVALQAWLNKLEEWLQTSLSLPDCIHFRTAQSLHCSFCCYSKPRKSKAKRVTLVLFCSASTAAHELDDKCRVAALL